MTIYDQSEQPKQRTLLTCFRAEERGQELSVILDLRTKRVTQKVFGEF